MNALKNLAFLAFFTLLLSSCGGDHLADPDSFPATYSTTGSFLDSKIPETHKVSFNATQGRILTTNKGTIFNFPPNAFVDGGGTTVSGNIDVEILELRKKSEMVFARTSTLTQKDEILETGGMFRIIATQNGNEIYIAPDQAFSVEFPSDNMQPDMQVFEGGGEVFTQWNLDTSSSISTDSSTNVYNVFHNKLNWVNIDRFNTGPFTNITVTPQSNENTTGVVAFLIYKNLNIATHIPYNHADKNFQLKNIPYNTEVTIVAVGLNTRKQIVAAFHNVLLDANKNYTVNLTEMTDESFKGKLERLD